MKNLGYKKKRRYCMISILICEDETYFLDHIVKLLDEYLKSK